MRKAQIPPWNGSLRSLRHQRKASSPFMGLLVEASSEVIPPAIAAIVAELRPAQSVGSIERSLTEILSRRFRIEGNLDYVSAPDYELGVSCDSRSESISGTDVISVSVGTPTPLPWSARWHPTMS